MGLIDIMKFFNDPEFQAKVDGLISKAGPILDRLERAEAALELLAEREGIPQADIDERVTLNKEFRHGKMQEVRRPNRK